MAVKETFFGSLEPLLIMDGKVVTELAKFKEPGRSHTHNQWEICFVLKGRGKISEGENTHNVGPGSVVYIPPNTGHWMFPDKDNTEPWEILLVYSDQ